MGFLFGCSHRNTSFPITRRSGSRPGAPAQTYVVCLECGKELPYSWDEMRIVKRPRLEADKAMNTNVPVQHS